MATIFESPSTPEEEVNENEQEKEISPEKVQELQDTIRIANILVGVLLSRAELLQAENAELREEKNIDKLSKARTEVGFHEALKERRESNEVGDLVLMYVDADGFKEINDTFGHDAGDFIIAEIARYLETQVRDTDVVARFHGDEFVVAFAGATESEIAEKFQNGKLAFTANYKGTEIPITLSAGVTAFREGETVQEAINRADESMYVSKQKSHSGR